MDQHSIEEYKRTLGNYLPTQAVDRVFDYMDHYCVRLHITRERRSKLGDYRWPQPRHNYHEISVNGNLNEYYFLWVLLHEMAHLNCHQQYGSEVAPHGHEWQEEYRVLIIDYADCFAPDLLPLLKQYCSRIPLSHTIETKIEQHLKHHDANYIATTCTLLNELTPGATFRIKARPERCFRAIEKRRTRWLCEDIRNKQKFLVNGNAEVEEC